MNMKKIGPLLFILLLGVSLQSCTDRVVSTLSEPFNILSGRVNVQGILTETDPDYFGFAIVVTHDRRQFKTGTGIMGSGDIKKAVSRIKKSVGWKGNYLFVTEDCGGGNIWRCYVEHVFAIRQGQLIYIGSVVQQDLDNKPGSCYRNGYFFDIYDRLEDNDLTSHASAPAIHIVTKEKGGRFIVDLERTWRENLSQYKQNLEDIKGLKDEKYDYGKDSVERYQTPERVLFNTVLAKYCRHQGELMQTMKEAKSTLKEVDFIKLEVILNEVVPGELPNCEEKYDSCFHEFVTEIVQTLQPR